MLKIVNKQNIFLQYMYTSYRSTLNPSGYDPAPYGGWVIVIVDLIALLVCLFSMYFILGFGIRYGSDVAELWLTQFVSSILMTFLTTTAVKRLVVDLLKSIAKQTTNTLDDKAVAMLEKQLFP